MNDRHKEDLVEKEKNISTSSENALPDKFNMMKTQCLHTIQQNLKGLPLDLIENAKEAKVRSVNLSKNNFTDFPDNIVELSEHLEQLNLSQNKIKVVSNIVGKFERLIYLNLSANGIGALPDEISYLIYLRELDLSYNR